MITVFCLLLFWRSLGSLDSLALVKEDAVVVVGGRGDGKLCPPKAKCAARVQVGAGSGMKNV